MCSSAALAAAMVVWTVEPQAPPSVVRRCPRCDVLRPFSSTGRFRLNGNGRRLDLWLIYRCTTCDATWNLTVARRVSPAALGADLARFERNDPDLARAVAFDGALLASAGVQPEPVPWTLTAPAPPCAVIVEIRCDWGPAPRLDAVLARGLGLSRSAVARLRVGIDRRTLRRPVVDGQRVALGVAGLVAPTAR